MKLNRKLSMFTSLFLIIGLVASLYIYFETNKLIRLYEETLRNDSKTLLKTTMNLLTENHKKTIYDYTNWDEMANFIRQPITDWANENLEEGLIQGMKYDFVKIYDLKKNEKYGIDRIGLNNIINDQMIELDTFKIKEFYFYFNGRLTNAFLTSVNSSYDLEKSRTRFGYLVAADIIDSAHLKMLETLSKCKITVSQSFKPDKERPLISAIPLNDYKGGIAAYLIIEPELTNISLSFIKLSENMPFIYLFIMLSFSYLLIRLINKEISKPLEEVYSILLNIFSNTNNSHDSKEDDITQLRRLAETIKIQKKELDTVSERLKLATQNAKIRIWDFDILNGKVTFHDLFSDDTIPKLITTKFDDWLEGIHHEDSQKFLTTLNEAISEKNNFEAEFKVFSKSGELKYFKSYAHLYLKEDIPARLTGINIDFTNEKEYENAILLSRDEAAKANKVKSEFIANISHEIKTPINSILGFSDILLKSNIDNQQRSSIECINRAGKNLLDLINDILDISKISSGKIDVQLQPLNLIELIDEVSEMFVPQIKNKNLDFKINIEKDFPNIILSDRILLRQILFNLIGNAIKFTFRGGVEVSVKTTSVNNSLNRFNFSLEIHDSGIGIESNEINTIFDEFERLESNRHFNVEGTGLGLTIVKKLVTLMKGTIRVESEPNRGTTFTISFFDIEFIYNGSLDSPSLTMNLLNENNFLISKEEFTGKEDLFPYIYIELSNQLKKLTEYTSISGLNDLIFTLNELGKVNQIQSLSTASSELQMYLSEFDFNRIATLLNKLMIFLDEINSDSYGK